MVIYNLGERKMGISFRHSAGFGKRMEYYLIGQMLMEGLEQLLRRQEV